MKSPAEIGMHRRAAPLSDDALDQVIRLAKPGAFEGSILAALYGTVFKGGGDCAGNAFILGFGPGRSFAANSLAAATFRLTTD